LESSLDFDLNLK